MTADSRRHLVFVILILSYSYFFPRWADWNQNSRFDMTRALVERNTLAIDAYYPNTGDYATVGGHIYSDKAPGLSYAAAIPYAAFYYVSRTPFFAAILERLASGAALGQTLNPNGTGLNPDKIRSAAGLLVVTFALVMLPSALLGIVMYDLLGNLGVSPVAQTLTPLVYGLATPAFPYSAAFYGHQFVAVLLMCSFYLAFLVKRGQLGQYALCVTAFLLGYTVVSEYPAGLVAVGVTAYALTCFRHLGWVFAALVAGLVPLALLAAHNNAILGTPFTLAYAHSTLWQETHSVGFLSLTTPTWESFWGITFGAHRGLFFCSPVILIAILGFYEWWKRHSYRLEMYVCIWAVLSMLVFNACSSMWDGGFGVGPRYVVPMLPFAALGLAYALKRLWPQRRLRLGFSALAAWSGIVIWVQTISGQAFPDYTHNALLDYSLPKLLAADIARNFGMVVGLEGIWSLLPLAGALSLFSVMVTWPLGVCPSIRESALGGKNKKGR